MKIAVGIISYNRYHLCAATLTNLISCRFSDTKFIIYDDASPGSRMDDLYAAFHAAAARQGNRCIIIKSPEHMGLPGLSLAFKSVIQASEGCDKLFLIPDDVILNQHTYDVIVKCQHKICSLFSDSRGDIFNRKYKQKADKHWHTISGVDGFAVILDMAYAKSLDWSVDMDDAIARGRSLIWHKIAMQCDDVWCSNESLCEHIGNIQNATHDRKKKDEKYIKAENLNIFRRPELLSL